MVSDLRTYGRYYRDATGRVYLYDHGFEFKVGKRVLARLKPEDIHDEPKWGN